MTGQTLSIITTVKFNNLPAKNLINNILQGSPVLPVRAAYLRPASFRYLLIISWLWSSDLLAGRIMLLNFATDRIRSFPWVPRLF